MSIGNIIGKAAAKWSNLRFGNWFLRAVLSAVLFYIFFLPFLFIIPLSFNDSRFMAFPPKAYSLKWYKAYLTSPDWLHATLFSIGVATTTMIFATILGSMAAIALVRANFKGKNLLNSLFILPMLVPLVVTAIALFFFLGTLNLTDTFPGMVLGHTVLAIPFVVINIGAVLGNFDISLEQAAMNLGASPLQAFLKVTFPIIRPGVISGAAFAFLASWDEVVLAIFLTGIRHYTLPRKMWESIRFEINPMLAVVAMVLTGISILFIFIAHSRKGIT